MHLLSKLHARLGDFWWYSLLLFAALRCGDLINAFVGLWLVPKYVPPEELGAVLPLTQFASAFALPVTILVYVFTKFLAQFKAKNELGKIKSLLRWFIGFVIVASILSIFVAKFTLPALFDRIRIADGSLTILIIAAGITNTIAPVFNNALQGLKKFKTITAINLFSAPIRLITMLLTLPIRALSGYMVGQIAPQLYAIGASCFALRGHVDKSIVSVPFWRDDLRPILRYLGFCMLWMIPGTITVTLNTMIIRQRLPEIESAAFYIISRFSDLAALAGTTIAFVMFPIVTNEKSGQENYKLLRNANLATFAFGMVISGILLIFGKSIFQALPLYAPYANFVPDMVMLSVATTLSAIGTNFATYETAHSRFDFLWQLAIGIPTTIFLVCFTGYTFFDGIFPPAVVSWMGSLHIATLRNVMWIKLISGTLVLILLYALCLKHQHSTLTQQDCHAPKD